MPKEDTAKTTNQTDEADGERSHPIPTIYYDQLFGEVEKSNEEDEDMRYVYLSDSVITSIGGARGAGKSILLAYTGTVAMACGLPVWSNFPIRAHYIDHNDHLRELESRPLMFKDLFNQTHEVKGGKILIDEYQDWGNAFAFMSTQNKLLNAYWAQIRKDEMSFDYASKKSRWVDLRTREETDIEINCRDAYHIVGRGRQKERGNKIFLDVKDMSGMWTGQQYEESGIVYSYELFAGIVRDAYDTKNRFDIFEAMRGVKLDLQKDIITDKDEAQSMSFEGIEKKIESMFSSWPRIKESEFWATLGIKKPEHKAQIRPIMRDMGITDRHTNRGTELVMEGFSTYAPERDRNEPVLAGVGGN